MRVEHSVIYVRWSDSCMQERADDDSDLPVPSVLHSVGWLVQDGPGHIVLAQDHNTDPTCQRWRRLVAIPRHAILETHLVKDAG